MYKARAVGFPVNFITGHEWFLRGKEVQIWFPENDQRLHNLTKGRPVHVIQFKWQ